MNIDFIGRRKAAYIFSGTLILVGLVGSIIKGGPSLGIDFTGGILIRGCFKERVSLDQLSRMRTILKQKGIDGNIQSLGRDEREILIKMRAEGDSDLARTAKVIESTLKAEFAEFDKVLESEAIDPVISKDIRRGASFAIISALAGILIYVGLRFKFKWGAAGVIAMVHDVLITAFFLILVGVDFDISIIAALLTLAGYSINDTIVLFDRIRENLRLLRNETFGDLINTSINQTLSRTIITGLTVFLADISLYLWGGEVIRPFALTLLFGIVIGTYSSIFVASPILLDWRGRK